MKEKNRINLENSKTYTENEFSGVLFQYARIYGQLLGIDFDKEVFPNINNKNWWEADYGQESRDGKSIGMSTKDALRCLVDTHRTYQLYLGIKESVNFLKNSGKEKITAIDAGTGTGILASILVASGVETVHAIEINKETFGITKTFLENVGLNKNIKILNADATRVEMDKILETPADILVSENLANGLLDEPQYDIISHLSKFLSRNAEIIPSGATIYASLALVDWDGIGPTENSANATRLQSKYIISPRIKYASVESLAGMQIPTIVSETKIPTFFEGPINSLLISTRFQINKQGNLIYLDPDSARFLGETTAFRLSSPIFAKDGFVDLNLKYEVGRERKHIQLSTEGNTINLMDMMLK